MVTVRIRPNPGTPRIPLPFGMRHAAHLRWCAPPVLGVLFQEVEHSYDDDDQPLYGAEPQARGFEHLDAFGESAVGLTQKKGAYEWLSKDGQQQQQEVEHRQPRRKRAE